MDVYEIRRLNARALSAEAGGLIEFGTRLERAQSLVSRWIGKTKNPKNIGNNAARQIEVVFRKPVGWLDQEHRELWEEHGFVQPEQRPREKKTTPSERALRIAQIIDEAPPEKVQAILLLLGASEEDIRRLARHNPAPEVSQDSIPATEERRSSRDRRQNIQAVDFERRSGLDRRDDEAVRLSHNDLLREAKKSHKTRKDDDVS